MSAKPNLKVVASGPKPPARPLFNPYVTVPREAVALAEELRVGSGRVGIALDRATTPASILTTKASLVRIEEIARELRRMLP